MRHPHITPTDLARQPNWQLWIAQQLGLTDYSDRLARAALVRCLLLAASLRSALSAVARRASGRGRETVRKAIRACLPDDPGQLERRLAAGLRRTLPPARKRRPVPIAIDLHRRPYSGDRDRTPGVTGGKAQRGAKWFWSYATAVSLARGQRHTLALTMLGRADTPAAVVERLLAQVAWSGVGVRYVLLDRGFYAVGVIRALQRRGLRFVLPMVRVARTEPFFRRGARGWFDYTLRGRRRAGAADVRVAVVPGPDGRRPLVFACSGGFGSLPGVALRYRRRFGIESSYRQLGECLARTTSRERVYRLLLVCVSVLVREGWLAWGGVTLGVVRWSLVVSLTPAADPTPPNTQPVTPPPLNDS
jgi:hypothetical protein